LRVSRSYEAKKLGIKMAVPFFQIEDIVQQHQVAVLSSNYALYAEMSRRFMNILSGLWILGKKFIRLMNAF
jgi:DNA polymerase V